MPFKVESVLARAMYRAVNARPSSAPFVSGDTFRKLARHVFERGRSFRPHEVQFGEIVFVETTLLREFASKYLPQIERPFVLITHNGDPNIDDSYSSLAEDPRIIHWYAQNCLLQHPKLTAIPIGLENRRLHANGVLGDYKKLRRHPCGKLMRILYGFTTETNASERKPALEALRRCPVAESLPRTNSRRYRELLNQYAFVASPPGNGIDCHRTWEALYVGTVPIVKRSTFYYSFPSLPALLVEDWEEICRWDGSFLETAYQRLSPAIAATRFLDFSYWAEIIQASRISKN